MTSEQWLRLVFISRRKGSVTMEELHSHDGYALFYNVSGTARVLVQKEKNNLEQIELSAGDFAFLSCRVKHRLHMTEQDNCHLFHVFMKEREKGDTPFCLSLLNATSPEAGKLLMQPGIIWKGKDMAGILQSRLTDILHMSYYTRKEPILHNVLDLLLMSCFVEMGYIRTQEEKNSASRYVNHAILYIKRNASRCFYIGDVARDVGLHPSYLQRLFKEETGSSIVAYTNECRVENAKRMLRNSYYSVIDISVENGFNSRQHFARCFKEITGMTPGEYRYKFMEKGEQKQNIVINKRYKP